MSNILMNQWVILGVPNSIIKTIALPWEDILFLNLDGEYTLVMPQLTAYSHMRQAFL